MPAARFLEGGNESATGRSRLSDPVPIRLEGVLAAGATVAANTVAYERVYAAGVTTLYVTMKASNVNGGTHTLKIYPLQDGGVPPATMKDDTVGTRSEVNSSTGITITTSAQEDSYTTRGEAWFDIEIDTDGTNACVISYVEVYGI